MRRNKVFNSVSTAIRQHPCKHHLSQDREPVRAPESSHCPCPVSPSPTRGNCSSDFCLSELCFRKSSFDVQRYRRGLLTPSESLVCALSQTTLSFQTPLALDNPPRLPPNPQNLFVNICGHEGPLKLDCWNLFLDLICISCKSDSSLRGGSASPGINETCVSVGVDRVT